MSHLGRLLIVLLIAAVPLQGAAAASRWLCLASSHHDAATVAEHSHVAHRHGEPAPENHEHGTAGHAHTTDALVQPGGDAGAPAASSSCNLCAACCLTVASPPARLEPPAAPAVSADFPPLSPAAAEFLARGLERPPRLA
jgi:hypothetical protein